MIKKNKAPISLKYAVMDAPKMLERYDCRYTYFMQRRHNSVDEFKVIYDHDEHIIIFSDQIGLTQAALKKFTDIFTKIANSTYLDGELQDKRFETIKNAFGKEGIDTALDIFHQFRRLYKK